MRSYIGCAICPGEKIRLTFGPDSLCACCPHNTDGLWTQEKVSRFDRKTVEYFGLHEGEYVYQDLIRAIDAQMTPAMLEDICRGCAWYPVSACKRISAANEMRHTEGVPLRLSKNFVFRTASRSNHDFERISKNRVLRTFFLPLYKFRDTQGELPHSGKRGWPGPCSRNL